MLGTRPFALQDRGAPADMQFMSNFGSHDRGPSSDSSVPSDVGLTPAPRESSWTGGAGSRMTLGTTRRGALIKRRRLRLSAAVESAIRPLRHAAHRRWTVYRDTRFDRRRGLDTAGIGEAIIVGDWGYYQPSPPRRFEDLIRAIDVDPSGFTFFDMGCGKGRTLVLAAELGFDRVVGVEYDDGLADVARRNTAGIHPAHGPVEVTVLDAGEYEFPDEPSVVYFYNPFFGETMKRVLENLRRSLTVSPRPVFVVYYTPDERHLFDSAGFLHPVYEDPEAVIYRASLDA